MTKKATMTDIARLAGVSQATVSFVLGDGKNTKIKISAATQERVINAARQLNYRPNEAAVALVTGRYSCIQLFISDVTDPFFAELIHGVEDEARMRRYRMFLRSTRFSSELELQSFGDLDNYMVDGVIVCGSNIPREELSRLAQTHKIVFINERMFTDGGQIRIDDAAGFLGAMEELRRLGRRRFAYVSAPGDRTTLNNRLNSFTDAISRCGLPFDPSADVFYASKVGYDEGLQLGIALADRFSGAGTRPDAVFCFNDLLALGVMKGLRLGGRRVPDDVSVIGFDNIEAGRMASPALSTIDVPRYEIGRSAMRMLEDMIEENASSPRLLTIESRFLPRESHA